MVGESSLHPVVLDLIRIRWRFLVMLAVVVVVSAIVSNFFPKKYLSSCAVVLDTESDIPGLPKGIGDFDVMGLNLGSGDDAATIMEAILYSRELAVKTIRTLNLEKRLQKKILEHQVKEFHSGLDLDIDSPIFRFSYLDRSPKASHEVVDFIARELDTLYRAVLVSKARSKRLFLEERANVIRSRIKEDEDSLRVFQERYGVLEPSVQAKASIEVLAELEADVAKEEIKLAIVQQSFSQDHAKVRMLRKSIGAGRAKIRRMMTGPKGKEKAASTSVLPLNRAPFYVVEYMRRKRELLVSEKVLEFVLPQLEAAKLEEVRDTPRFEIVDPPYVPTYKASPKRAFIVAGFTLVFLVLFLGYRILVLYLNDPRFASSNFTKTLSQIQNALK